MSSTSVVTSTTTTVMTMMIATVLSLPAMSSFVVAAHSGTEQLSTSLSDRVVSPTPFQLQPGAVATTTTPPSAVIHAAESSSSPATVTTPRAVYVRGHRVQHGGMSRPEPEVDRSDARRRSNSSEMSGDSEFDEFRRKKFRLMSAAQSSSGSGMRRLPSRRLPVGPSVTTRLLYGALALVLASVLTPLVCLAVGLVRTKISRCLERRRRFDKTGEYERVDSVSSVVDSSVHAGSLSQLDVYIDDPFAIEDVTII